MIDRAAFAVGALAVLLALVGGYAWQSLRASAAAAEVRQTQQAGAEATAGRADALVAIDEAVRARYEERKEGALAALARARKIDPQAPGLAIAFAELALENNEFELVRSTVSEHIRHGKDAAQAHTLLGVHRWLTRGSTPDEVSRSIEESLTSFARATDAEASFAPAYFFSGDMLRYAGRQGEGHKRLLAALHRFAPWSSADVVAMKLAAALHEAGDAPLAGLAFITQSPLLDAVTAHFSSGKDEEDLPATVGGLTARLSVSALAGASDALERQTDDAAVVPTNLPAGP